MATKAILVVDPDRFSLALLTQILELEGYEASAAHSLAEATTLLSNSHFDLFITEALCQSKPLDFDPSFLTKIRALVGDTPVILISTYASSGMVRRGDFGLADVVPKPFDIDDLVRKVNRVLDNAEPRLEETR
ncbi:MAG: response regulator [Chloroflexi bacterium]|nr:response regulator [Chloroflexota bacterium]MDA8188480.1 response regulator [Dehalococcoidales bacterium]